MGNRWNTYEAAARVELPMSDRTARPRPGMKLRIDVEGDAEPTGTATGVPMPMPPPVAPRPRPPAGSERQRLPHAAADGGGTPEDGAGVDGVERLAVVAATIVGFFGMIAAMVMFHNLDIGGQGSVVAALLLVASGALSGRLIDERRVVSLHHPASCFVIYKSLVL